MMFEMWAPCAGWTGYPPIRLPAAALASTSVPLTQIVIPYVIAFLVGSIPFGLIVARLIFGSDIRRTGSGNIGAANALRSYGKAGGALVLALDALKGFAPSAWASGFLLTGCSLSPGFGASVGLAAVLGHCYCPWLRFKGGKGVATYLGVLFAVSWAAGLAFILVWMACVVPTRYASLGSVVASVASVAVVWFVWHDSFATASCAIAVLVVILKHRENIARLAAGRENKIGLSKSQP